MNDNPTDFFDEMLAVGQRASGMDERVALAMGEAGFSQSEIVDVLATSRWAVYQREFMRVHGLPCSVAVSAALREAFDAGENDEKALKRVLATVGRFGAPPDSLRLMKGY